MHSADTWPISVIGLCFPPSKPSSLSLGLTFAHGLRAAMNRVLWMASYRYGEPRLHRTTVSTGLIRRSIWWIEYVFLVWRD